MKDLVLPPRYGTNNCYECGREPTADEIEKSKKEDLAPFWEKFVVIDEKQVSVPICPACMFISEQAQKDKGIGGPLSST